MIDTRRPLRLTDAGRAASGVVGGGEHTGQSKAEKRQKGREAEDAREPGSGRGGLHDNGVTSR
jgi:hypothetical protein